ncbi:enterobactin transporter EntS [Nocardiopsis composta]|uniref:ENTS family enterobactin (Siderophore) exporter n=2 Tax=Nocardiopsis composta TaxID=157465 RepID=A0A7W8QKV9_9ACTN|nr:enterobactin transporter EntS [Nocardiopsis composta]MBB5431658.1 ENTS family enterobactin (siderophore) exporter [Nocardiopsis composta]
MRRLRAASLAIDLSPLRAGGGFRILFAVRLVSLLGGGYRMVALPLQVYAMTGSSVLVASVSVVNGLSSFAGTLGGGLLADRMDRRRLMLAALVAETAVVSGFALNTVLPGGPRLEVIYLCAAVNGCFGTTGLLAQQAMVPALVGRDRLPAAGALFALTAQAGAVFTPALGGLVIATAGIAAGFAGTAVIAALASAAVLFLPAARPDGAEAGGGLRAASAGLRFAVRDPVVRPLMALGFTQAVLALPLVLIPEFTDRVLDGGAREAGLLYSAPAAGAIIASLTSGWTGRVARPGAVVCGAVAGCGAAVAALGVSPSLPFALAALLALGCAQAVEEILRYALVQERTPDALRGRVSGVWLAQATVGGSLGVSVMGALAGLLGPAAALLAAGSACTALVAAVTAADPGLRRLRRPGPPPAPPPAADPPAGGPPPVDPTDTPP